MSCNCVKTPWDDVKPGDVYHHIGDCGPRTWYVAILTHGTWGRGQTPAIICVEYLDPLRALFTAKPVNEVEEEDGTIYVVPHSVLGEAR